MRTQVYTILSFLLFTIGLNGQNAIDFTFTDTKGEEHSLYEDYLDQGKTVLIDWFFVDCPPCNTFAPTLQEIYEEWGEGAEDVEFFSLSNKTWDSNEDVIVYEDRHQLTNPGAGNDGGAYDISTLYHDSEFGPIYSTPHFTVIAPNGTVYPDVDGIGTEGRIEAIHEAISAARAMVEPTDTMVVVSETIDTFNYQFSLLDTRGKSVTGVNYIIQSSDGIGPIYPITIPDDGKLTIIDFETTYPNLTNPIISFNKTGGDLDGVFTSDIILILRHLLGIQPFDQSYQYVAADVSNDGSVSAADMSIIRKSILQQLDGYPSGITWKFEPNQLILDLDQPGDTNIEIQAIKIGDVNRH